MCIPGRVFVFPVKDRIPTVETHNLGFVIFEAAKYLNHLVGVVVIRKMVEPGLCQLLGSHVQVSRPIVETGKACILVLKLRGGVSFRFLRTFLKSHIGIHR